MPYEANISLGIFGRQHSDKDFLSDSQYTSSPFCPHSPRQNGRPPYLLNSSAPTILPDSTMDTELDPEIDMSIDPAPPDPENVSLEAEAVPEAREPTKKDISLRDFLSKMDDYAPIV